MKKIFIFTLAGLSLLLGSCKKDWLTLKPKGQANFETLLNKDGVNLLLIGAYADVDGANNKSAQPQGWPSGVSNWVWGSVAGGDAYKGSNSGDQALINDIAGFYLTADNTYVNSHWMLEYDGVVRCNDVLKAVALATGMTEVEKLQAQAQARFLRAHYYVELTNVHGKVPYIDENTVNPTIVPNDHLVWPEIEADLKFAIANLPSRWTDKGRANQWAAKTYLARAYLAQQKYALAMPLLQDVYTNGGFTLVPDFIQNFLIATVNNAESIFEVQYAVNDGFGADNANIADALNSPTFKSSSNFFQPSHALVSAFRVNNNGLPVNPDATQYTADEILPFDPTGQTVPYKNFVDPRLDWTVARPGVPDFDWGIPTIAWIRDPNNGGPYMSKKSTYLKAEKNIYSSTTVRPGANANNFRKFKLSHVILWLAECEIEVGSLRNATTLVNQIRNRAKGSNVVKFDNGTPAANYKVEPYTADFATKEEARLAVRHEERLEFALEGVRFFDLVRWGIAAPVLNRYLSVDGKIMPSLLNKTFVAGQHEVRPIPQAQIDLSKKDGQPVLVQNPGY
ncbi:MAG TPA: RagB/SusD family nutrient uptake outer membrane protein [Chitinophagaceae bacterium]|nr:RagB/SusD family nutrient uptake outer membrane protein [Chitinophagaceae bacterium]